MNGKKSILAGIFRKKSDDNLTETAAEIAQNDSEGIVSDYLSYLACSKNSNFSGLFIETRYKKPDTHIKTFEEQANTIIDTCSQIFTVCKIQHFIERDGNNFLCYLNFEEYNIRVLCEFAKQLLYNNTDYIDYNFYYCSTSDDAEEIAGEMAFLRTLPPYSLFFGFNKKIRSFYFRDCEVATGTLSSVPLAAALKANELEDAMNFLAEKKQEMELVIHTNYRYSYRVLYDFLLDTYFTLLDFYKNPEMPGPEYDEDFEKMVGSFEDATFFIEKLYDDLQDYANKYPAFRMQSLEKDLIYEAQRYILNNIDHVSLQEVADHFNVSYAHLSRLFKKNTKRNFTDFVSDLKLEMAAQYLREGNLSISEITNRLGYSSTSYFLSKFKERYKMTPSAFRKEYFIKKN